MNSVNIIILVLLLIAAVRGLMKGIIKEIAGLVGVILGIIISIKGASYTADFLRDAFGINDSWLKPVAFITTFVLIVLVIKILAIFLDKLFSSIGLSLLIRIGGALIASIKAIFIVGIILIALLQINRSLKGALFDPVAIEDSSLAELSITVTEFIIPDDLFSNTQGNREYYNRGTKPQKIKI